MTQWVAAKLVAHEREEFVCEGVTLARVDALLCRNPRFSAPVVFLFRHQFKAGVLAKAMHLSDRQLECSFLATEFKSGTLDGVLR